MCALIGLFIPLEESVMDYYLTSAEREGEKRESWVFGWLHKG